MPLNLQTNESENILKLDGIITAEDTDEFISCLREYPNLTIDLSTCEHLHTAVLQALLILKPEILSLPENPFWSKCLIIKKGENE